jgi:hypothetical protein
MQSKQLLFSHLRATASLARHHVEYVRSHETLQPWRLLDLFRSQPLISHILCCARVIPRHRSVVDLVGEMVVNFGLVSYTLR